MYNIFHFAKVDNFFKLHSDGEKNIKYMVFNRKGAKGFRKGRKG